MKILTRLLSGALAFIMLALCFGIAPIPAKATVYGSIPCQTSNSAEIPNGSQNPVMKNGDLDGSGQINNLDVAYLLWHTLFPEDYPVSGDVDFNLDNEVNNEDVAYLLWHTLFPEDYPLPESGNIWARIPDDYICTPGAGGWGTDLTIADDGSFTGNCYNSEYGESGPGYLGTMYLNSFKGKFSTPKKVGPFKYTMTLESLSYDVTPGKVVYRDNTRYVYITADFIGDVSDEFELYLPGMLVSQLTDSFLFWVNYANAEVLPIHALYNVNEEAGFQEF